MSDWLAEIVLYGTGLFAIFAIVIAYHIKVNVVYKKKYEQAELRVAKEREQLMRDIQDAEKKYGTKLKEIERRYYEQWPRKRGWKDIWHL